MDGNVDIRITPLANFSIQDKSFLEKSRLANSKPNLSQQLHHSSYISASKLKQPAPTSPLTTTNSKNHLLVLSKEGINKPTLSVKTFSNNHHIPSHHDKKGLLLYRQIENNKQFNGEELVNRFNYRV